MRDTYQENAIEIQGKICNNVQKRAVHNGPPQISINMQKEVEKRVYCNMFLNVLTTNMFLKIIRPTYIQLYENETGVDLNKRGVVVDMYILRSLSELQISRNPPPPPFKSSSNTIKIAI